MNTYSWISLVTYHNDKDDIAQVLDKHTEVISYCFILHDKFTDEELKTEKPNPHTHINIHLRNSRTEEQVRNWFKMFPENTLSKPIKSPKKALEYLTHSNDITKWKYDVSEIVDSGYIDEVTNGKTDHTSIILDRLAKGESVRSLAAEYGKDFVYHVTQYLKCAELLRAEENEQIEKDDEQQTINALERVNNAYFHALLIVADFVPRTILDTVIEMHLRFPNEVDTLKSILEYADDKYRKKFGKNLDNPLTKQK